MTVMMDEKTIESIARQVATANLGIASIDRIIPPKEIIDSEGREALQIVIVLTPGSTDTLKGSEFLNTMVEIHDLLQKAGEKRFPFVKYADKNELEESAAAQP
jgi:hypothetical protein